MADNDSTEKLWAKHVYDELLNHSACLAEIKRDHSKSLDEIKKDLHELKLKVYTDYTELKITSNRSAKIWGVVGGAVPVLTMLGVAAIWWLIKTKI